MNVQEKITIDVVLLFPENINNICKELNKTSDMNNYVSFEDGYHPHLTLGMGSLFVSDIEEFKKDIELVLERCTISEITLTSLTLSKYNQFTLEVDEHLQNLHNAVFDAIVKHSAGEVTAEHFFEMNKSTSLINWVNNFKENNAYANYHPHVTIGRDITEIPLAFPITFKPESVGLFHLGKHGVCKKLITTFDISM